MTTSFAAPIRAIVYVRLSSYKGDADPTTSPERQEQICRDYCAAKGWQVIDVISDLDVSGSDKGLRLNRPGLETIRSRWAETDIVIFSKLDRMARNVIDFRTFADEAAANGAALVSVNESLDLTTPGGRFVATILAAFAEMEAATIAERTMAGIDTVKRAGRFAGGNVPFGYEVANDPKSAGKILIINPSEQLLMIEAADRILKGESPAAICRDWDRRGIKARRGGKILAQSLRVALTGDAIVGRVTHKGELLRDEETGLPIEFWTPVIPVETWQRVKAALAPKPMEAPRKKRTRILSGIIRCAHCGSKLQARMSGGQYATYAYSCPARSEGRDCVGVSIKADTVDDYVIDGFIIGYFGEDEWVERREISRSRAELEDVEIAIKQTTNSMTAPDADISALVNRLNILRARREELEAMPATTEWEYVETGESFLEHWNSAELPERQKILGMVIKEVRISKGGRGAFDKSRIKVIHDPDFFKPVRVTDVFEDAV